MCFGKHIVYQTKLPPSWYFSQPPPKKKISGQDKEINEQSWVQGDIATYKVLNLDMCLYWLLFVAITKLLRKLKGERTYCSEVHSQPSKGCHGDRSAVESAHLFAEEEQGCRQEVELSRKPQDRCLSDPPTLGSMT